MCRHILQFTLSKYLKFQLERRAVRLRGDDPADAALEERNVDSMAPIASGMMGAMEVF